MKRYEVVGRIEIGYQFEIMAETSEDAAAMAEQYAIHNQTYDVVLVDDVFNTATGEPE